MKVLYHHVSSEDEVPNVGTSLAQKSDEGEKEKSEDGRRRGGFKVEESVREDEVLSLNKVVGEKNKKKAADEDREPRYQGHMSQDLVAKYRSGGKLVQNHQRGSLKQEVQTTDFYKKVMAPRKEEEPYLPDAIEPEQVREKEAVVKIHHMYHIEFFIGHEVQADVLSQLEQLYQQFMAQGEERRREPLVRWMALQLLPLLI